MFWKKRLVNLNAKAAFLKSANYVFSDSSGIRPDIHHQA
jgi:hypothetical protein